MPRMTIAAAWNETSAFVRREARLLFPLAFVLVAIPQAVIQSLSGGPTMPGQPAAQASPLLAFLFVPLMAATMIGNLALSYLALRPGTTGGEALRVGVRRVLPLVGAVLLVAVPLAVVAVGLALALGIEAEATQMSTGDAMFFLLFLLAMVVIGVRLMLVTPAAASGAGAVEMLRRSWRLTGPVFWKLLGFLLLVMIVFFVLTVAVSAVGGVLILLLAGAPQPGSASSVLLLLLNAALQTVITVYLMSMVARIYAGLAGDDVPAPKAG